MAGIFKFEDKELQESLSSYQKIKKTVLSSWKSFMLRQTRRRYRAGVNPDGGVWAGSGRFKSSGAGRGTLWGRGDLFRSIVAFDSDDNTVGIGSDLIYAKTHQEGAKFTATKKQSVFLFYNVFKPAFGENAVWSWHYKINIPKREFLGISGDDVKGLKRLMIKAIEKFY